MGNICANTSTSCYHIIFKDFKKYKSRKVEIKIKKFYSFSLLILIILFQSGIWCREFYDWHLIRTTELIVDFKFQRFIPPRWNQSVWWASDEQRTSAALKVKVKQSNSQDLEKIFCISCDAKWPHSRQTCKWVDEEHTDSAIEYKVSEESKPTL